MNLKHLKDSELLTQTKRLVAQERELLTQVLHHLREVSRRKLYCDLGYSSLFDYAVKELRYSETQASRRIQAMRLLQELPEVEEKIATGKLSLTHLSSARKYFKEVEKKPPVLFNDQSAPRPLDRIEKLSVLKRLENTSTREGEKILLALQPQPPLPKERSRILTQEHIEMRFVMSSKLKQQLDQVRALMGSKGASLNLAELISVMAELSVESLAAKKFGKKRVQLGGLGHRPADVSGNPYVSPDKPASEMRQPMPPHAIGQSQNRNPSPICPPSIRQLAAPQVKTSKSVRYIPRSVKHAVWKRDHGKCANCGSQRNIQYDHIRPVAAHGASTLENLQLLCFSCNQRRAIKSFGIPSFAR